MDVILPFSYSQNQLKDGTVIKELHPLKHSVPNVRTLDGMKKSLKEEQSLNAPSSIVLN
jgi:hypothetical protein